MDPSVNVKLAKWSGKRAVRGEILFKSQFVHICSGQVRYRKSNAVSVHVCVAGVCVMCVTKE